MKYRKLGQTDLTISEVSVGCSGFWGQKNFPETRALDLIYRAHELGINHFDTGHNYCNFNAEPRLGRALTKLLKAVSREELVISSKGGTVIPHATFLASRNKNSKDFSPNAIEKSCAASVKNLNCDYLDIFYLHGIVQHEVTDELISRLDLMRRMGLFRYVGVNTHSVDMMNFIVQNSGLFDVVLLDYNVLQIDREPMIERLSQAGVGVIAGTVLAQGHLFKNKIGKIRSMADIWYLARALLKRTGRDFSKYSVEMKETLENIPSMNPAQIAFSYVLSNPSVASCIFGTTRIENLEDAVCAVDCILTASEKNKIIEVFQRMEISLSH